MAQQSGHCFCGAVTWQHNGTATRNLNCHCDECRRGVSGAFSAVAGLSAEGMTIDGPWADYRYTPESSRAFCTVCGTRIWFRSDLWPDEVFINVGALDAPQDHQPDQHVLYAQAVPWAPVADDIPKSASFQNPVTDAPDTSGPACITDAALSGRCLCGDVTWKTDAEPLWSGHCHCDSCRRATGAPFASFFGLRKGQAKWTGGMTEFSSANGKVQRRFCTTCGTHMVYEADIWPDESHLYAASLNDPSNYHPQAHIHCADKLAWVTLDDDLPSHSATTDGKDPTA